MRSCTFCPAYMLVMKPCSQQRMICAPNNQSTRFQLASVSEASLQQGYIHWHGSVLERCPVRALSAMAACNIGPESSGGAVAADMLL